MANPNITPVGFLNQLQPSIAGPLDSRFCFDTIANRDALADGARYAGLVTYVLEDDTVYILQGGTSNGHWQPLEGRSILSGNGVPADTLGRDGDTYLDRDTGDLYTKSDGAWTATGQSLRGIQGFQGIGITGVDNTSDVIAGMPRDVELLRTDPAGTTVSDLTVTLPPGAPGLNAALDGDGIGTVTTVPLNGDGTVGTATVSITGDAQNIEFNFGLPVGLEGVAGDDFIGVTFTGGSTLGEATVVQPRLQRPDGTMVNAGDPFTVQAGQRGERGPAGAGATIQVLNDNMVVHATGGSFEQFNFNGGITASQNQNNLEEVDINIDPIQAVVDQNSTNEIMYWYGTQAELQALIDAGSVQNNVLYTTTDDANLSVINEGTGLTARLADGRYGALADVTRNNAKLGLPIPDPAGANPVTDPSTDEGRVPTVQPDGTYVLQTPSTAGLTTLGITATADEINVLDGIPTTLTTTEIGYLDGVTSAIQTQLDTKADANNPSLTGTKSLDNGVFRVCLLYTSPSPRDS